MPRFDSALYTRPRIGVARHLPTMYDRRGVYHKASPTPRTYPQPPQRDSTPWWVYALALAGIGTAVAGGALAVNYALNAQRDQRRATARQCFVSPPWEGPALEDIVVIRLSPGPDGSRGAWWSPTAWSTAYDASECLALPSDNPGFCVAKGIIPRGTWIMYGNAAPAFGHPGGGHQVYTEPANVLITFSTCGAAGRDVCPECQVGAPSPSCESC
jgi:hypothetical protein